MRPKTKLPYLEMLAAAAICGGAAATLPSASFSDALHARQQARTATAMMVAPVLVEQAGMLTAPAGQPAVAATAAHAGKAETALQALAGSVKRQSHPDALRFAFEAYFNYREANPGKVRKPYLYFVDYGLDSNTPRGYVFDMVNLKVVDGPFNVAHGRGSGGNDAVPTRFGNRNGSATSSLGLFLAQETYAFSGHTGGRLYRSIGLRLNGLSGGFNSAARSRGVVVHGAPYVTASKAGRSEGCPAMEPARAQRLIPKIGNGGMVFLFSPRDKQWLTKDPWAHAEQNG